MGGKLLHAEITQLIIGAGMDVFNSVGPGWDEWDYHRAMMKALSDRGLKAESHLRGDLIHRGQCVDRFELDILVEDKVVLELKHIREKFAPEHYVQLISYLKFWEKDLGMLMNFGADHFRFKRVPYTPRECELATAGKWSELQTVCPMLLDSMRIACENILAEHGLGYSKNTSEKLLACELEHLEVDVQNPVVNLCYNDLQLGERESDSLVLDSSLVIMTSALPENTCSTDLVRLQSCMRQINIKHGLLTNFGKSILLLRAVCLH